MGDDAARAALKVGHKFRRRYGGDGAGDHSIGRRCIVEHAKDGALDLDLLNHAFLNIVHAIQRIFKRFTRPNARHNHLNIVNKIGGSHGSKSALDGR